MKTILHFLTWIVILTLTDRGSSHAFSARSFKKEEDAIHLKKLEHDYEQENYQLVSRELWEEFSEEKEIAAKNLAKPYFAKSLEDDNIWIERIDSLNEKERSAIVSKSFERLRNYFRQFQIELKEKFANFGEWVKTFAHKALETGRSKIENIKAIAKEVLDKADHLQRQVTVEALEFFRPYREHLGKLWDELLRKLNNV